MDQIDEVAAELQQVKGETAIVVKLKEGLKETRVILTNQDEISLKEWHTSLRTVLRQLISLMMNASPPLQGTPRFTGIAAADGPESHQDIRCQPRPNAARGRAARLRDACTSKSGSFR